MADLDVFWVAEKLNYEIFKLKGILKFQEVNDVVFG